MNYRIINGESLEEMRKMPDSSVDLIVTDPPYGINTKSTGAGKLNPWADLTNSAYWYTAWFLEAKRILKPTGAMWACLNWRSMVTFQKASCDSMWPITSLLVWDKCWIGPGGSAGLRPSYELVALFAMPDFRIPNRGLADIQKFKWSSRKPNGHPAEKPVDLMKFLIEESCSEGDLVMDPFMGSGTTGEAAISLGRRFEGVELDPAWVDVASTRIAGCADEL